MTLPVIVVKDQGRKMAMLLGRNWIKGLKLDWKTVMSLSHVTVANRVEALRAKLPTVFSSLGVINNYEAKVVLKPDCTPVFCKQRPVPFALRDWVEAHLKNLEKKRVVYRVTQSDWATPVVIVHKKDGSLRLCGDNKVMVNPLLKTDYYLLPRPEDLYSAIVGGKNVFVCWTCLLHTSRYR